MIFQPTLPARGATQNVHALGVLLAHISTHAPRTGSDTLPRVIRQRGRNFNPRSPHGERHSKENVLSWYGTFQPTLPARGATMLNSQQHGFHHISTHAPRTGSDDNPPDDDLPAEVISTHAPRTGSDARQKLLPDLVGISTHAPRTGSDPTASWFPFYDIISTHAPRTGSDLKRFQIKPGSRQFQPTLPARGATGGVSEHHRAPLNFNPRSPHGERRGVSEHHRAPLNFNPRSPHGERR